MTITLIFTATRRAGNYARILTALNRLGLKPRRGTLKNSADSGMDSIRMNLNGAHQIEAATITQLKEMVPTIVDVQIDSSSATQTRLSAPALTTARTARVSETSRRVKPMASKAEKLEQPATRPQFDDERLDLETKQLANAYPDQIYSALTQLEAKINPAQRSDVLGQLGFRLGMYAARKRKAAEKASRIDDTVRNSLAMQKAQFGQLSPVIADIVKKKAAKSTSAQSKATILVSELNQFLAVSLMGDEIKIAQCPHCESAHISPAPDCYFITAFIESFIKDMWREGKPEVTQTKSIATGGARCVFAVSGIEFM
ncbi:MAG: 4-vinyl reductase [Chloroflexota bacterium]